MAYSFLEPIRVGKMVLKNRIIVPAMARYLCEDGFATEDYIRYYEAMAKGGVAMVTVGIMPIDLGWPSTMPSQPCLGCLQEHIYPIALFPSDLCFMHCDSFYIPCKDHIPFF